MTNSPTARARTVSAAVGALALVATGGAVVASSPATALATQTLNYDCTWPLIGEFAVTAKHTVEAERRHTDYDYPDPTVVYGGSLPVSTIVTLSDGQPITEAEATCELADGQELSTDIQVRVTQAPTKTLVWPLKYDAASGKLVSEVVVYPTMSSIRPLGDIRFTLERNGRPFASVTKTSKLDGTRGSAATAKFVGPRTGTYELTVQYLGDDAGNFKPSTRVVTKTF